MNFTLKSLFLSTDCKGSLRWQAQIETFTLQIPEVGGGESHSRKLLFLACSAFSHLNVNLCDKPVPGAAKLIPWEAHGEELKWLLLLAELVPRRSSCLLMEDWQELHTLNITKLNGSVVEYEWSLLLAFVRWEQDSIVWFCASLACFPPREHGETCKPEQLHLYPPFFFQGLKCKSRWWCRRGRWW